jgi:hypothetical protein
VRADTHWPKAGLHIGHHFALEKDYVTSEERQYGDDDDCVDNRKDIWRD